MTETAKYFCKNCDFTKTLAMHGMDAKAGNGEIPVMCKRCGLFEVGTIKGWKVENPGCKKCGKPKEISDGSCPYCFSKEFYVETRAGAVKAPDLKQSMHEWKKQ